MAVPRENICLSATDTLKSVLSCLQLNEHRLCVVIDDSGKIIGTITDGDCRRALLKGMSLETPAASIMNQQFVVVDESFSLDHVKLLMRSNAIDQVPIVDADRRFKDVVSVHSLINRSEKKTNPVLILTGGKGTRLRPLTHNIPKPMLPVQGKPMLELLINNLVEAGFENIFLSINYLGHVIEEYFGDGQKFSCNIQYLKEDIELGTGGPLKLLEKFANEPIVALNGDLVTEVDFAAALDFHSKHNFDMTVGICSYAVEIPFGVIHFAENGEISKIAEKPQHSFNINAGLYVIEPRVLQYVPENQFYPMTTLVNQVRNDGKKVGAFPIHEVWNDVGVLAQYFAAQESIPS